MPKLKLTEEQARAIHADRRPYSVIAQTHGVTIVTVSQIKSGKTWKHLHLTPSTRQKTLAQFKRQEAKKEQNEPTVASAHNEPGASLGAS